MTAIIQAQHQILLALPEARSVVIIAVLCGVVAVLLGGAWAACWEMRQHDESEGA